MMLSLEFAIDYMKNEGSGSHVHSQQGSWTEANEAINLHLGINFMIRLNSNIETGYINDEDKTRELNWVSRLIGPLQKLIVAKYLTFEVKENFYNAFLFWKNIGIFQVSAKVSPNVPMARAQVRTFWQRCGVAMIAYDFIDEDLKKQGHRLVENPDQCFVRPASRELWKKRKKLGKC